MRRFISVILIAAAVLLESCAAFGNGGTASKNDAPNRGEVLDDLPSDLDYNGAMINILARDEAPYISELRSQKITGDVLNDAIYNRDKTVSDRLEVKFRYHFSPDVDDAAELSVLSGLDEYQIVGERAFDLAKDGSQGLYLNVLNKERFPYLDLDKPWWSSYYAEQAEIKGRLYTFVGDYSLTWLKGLQATFFNKSLAEQYGIDNLYEVVEKGEWTLDKQLEYAALVYRDVTGDGKSDDDVYGFGFDDYLTLDAYWSAFDMNLVSTDRETGIPSFSIDLEFHQKVLSKIYELMYNTRYCYCLKVMESENYGVDVIKTKMSEDELLFATMMFSDCDSSKLRNMKSEYGIIPMPKWDENQKDYYSASDENYTLLGVPIVCENPVMVSAVLEALSAESYRYVTPAYYNNVLKGRYMSDVESTKMVDMITSSYKTDFGVIYGLALDRVAHNTFRYFLRDGNSIIAGYWRANKKSYQRYLDDLIKSVDKSIAMGN